MNQSNTISRLPLIYSYVARWALYALVFLVPLTFFPVTVDALEISKQTVTVVLVAITVIAWLGLMVAERQFFVKKTWLFLLPVLMLVLVGISSATSLSPVLSWIGQSTQEHTSFLSLISFVLLFITGAHFLSETRVQRDVWMLSFVASGLIGLHAFFVAIGAPIFNTLFVGTPNALGFYLVAMSVIGSGLLLVRNAEAETAIISRGWKGVVTMVGIWTTLISTLVVLLTIDYWGLWAALILGLVIIFTFALLRAEEFPKSTRFIQPMLFFVLAIVFLFAPSFLNNKFPIEVAPSSNASWLIAKDTLQTSSWVLGSGPGTYTFDYTLHRPESVNITTLWNTRFDRASSHFLTMLPTYGVFATGLFILFLLSLFVVALLRLIQWQPHDEWKMTFVALSGWTVLAFGYFVYSSNFTLSFLFWMLSAVLASQVAREVKHVAFSQSPRGALVTTFLFVLTSVGLLTGVFVMASRYVAEVTFTKAVRASSDAEQMDEVITLLDRAARMNKWNDIYYRNLSSALLLKTSSLLSSDADSSVLQQYTALTINASRQAVNVSPNYVVNWNQLGVVYREFIPLVGNADIFSIDAFGQAIALAPTNPKYYTEQARSYLLRAENLSKLLESEEEGVAEEARTQRDASLQLAVDQLLKATELKPNYAVAQYYLALAYERQGNLSEAISRMELLKSQNQLDIGLHFQLGLLYLKQGKIEAAQESFETAVDIAPNYSNARWYLSAVYEEQGNIDAAIEQVEKTLELNEGNELIEQRLERLKNGNAQGDQIEPLEDVVDEAVEEVPLTTEE